MIENPSNWFEQLTGVRETSPEAVREQIVLQGDRMVSKANGKSWAYGTLETPTLAELRERVAALGPDNGRLRFSQVVANVRDLHADSQNQNALFQVASQFNLLEMTSERVTPEEGIGRYEHDHTQGPACAIAAGAGTIYRNYFVEIDGQMGQTQHRQIDCLSDIAAAFDNNTHGHWKMQNGYALPTSEGLKWIDQRLRDADESELDQLRGLLRIGLHWQTQVTLGDASHKVSQAYCSAMPVSYSGQEPETWELFARLILQAAYEATLCGGIINADEHKDRRLFLTWLGGGAFGNHKAWILDAIASAMARYAAHDLDVVMISYRSADPDIEAFIKQYT